MMLSHNRAYNEQVSALRGKFACIHHLWLPPRRSPDPGELFYRSRFIAS